MQMSWHCFGLSRQVFAGFLVGLLLTGWARSGTEVSVAQASRVESDLAAGGEVGAERSTLAVRHGWDLAQGRALGFRVMLEREVWDFDGAHRFGAAPWGEVDRFAISLPLRAPLSDRWQLVLIPRLGWAMEVGAQTGDARTAGLVAAAFKVFGPDRRLGLGLEANGTLDHALDRSPVLIVDWRFDEHWRLFNPLELGPSGPAGLELAYRFGDRLALGLGVTERDDSFRLARGHAIAADGIGEVKQKHGFLHLSWTPSPQAALHAYAGMVFDGVLIVRDRQGRNVVRDEQDTTPVLGLVGQLRF